MAGRLANRKRKGYEKLNTHWRTGCSDQSEFAFSKAFKKIVGDTPGALRRGAMRSV